MSSNKFGSKSLWVIMIVILIALSLALVSAENSVEPSAPNGNGTWKGNRTASYPNGTMWNYTRGYIHEINLDETAPTLKWIGYVGNITGKFALMDSNGYALYDWSIGTTRGEVYATKEGPCCDTGNSWDGNNGGIPMWESIACANAGNITKEEALMNHTIDYGAKADEDSYTHTFTTSGFTLDSNFYVGEEVEITTGSGCYGTNLYANGTKDASLWEEVVLMDGSREDEGSGGSIEEDQHDLIYASIIENDTFGYRNYTHYDFQILLPQSGLEGADNIAYYFYIELI